MGSCCSTRKPPVPAPVAVQPVLPYTIAYEMERRRDGGQGPGYHTRRVESIENAIPAPWCGEGRGKRYPHLYHNHSNHFPQSADPMMYFEAPLKYPQRAYIDNQLNQNSKGKYRHKDNRLDDAGFDRVVVDKNGNRVGVMYHPYGDKEKFKRAHSLLSDGTVRHHYKK
ncbi:hypothetical protein MRB53_037257 [Persea americana]|nr:hypothetical protein MRB53_037257 [Persea americana]